MLYAPPASIKYFTFGYREVFSDVLWLRFLQDFGICEQKFMPEGGARTGPNRVADCKKGWGYYMLDAITDLAPKFKIPMLVGPMTLSVIADDIEGASALFEKAVVRFPKDWSIFYRAGYHFLYEEGNNLKAARYFKMAGELGAPAWTLSLSAKLYSEVGRAIVGKILLEDYLKRAKAGARDNPKIKERLAEMNAIIEKERKAQYEQNRLKKLKEKKQVH